MITSPPSVGRIVHYVSRGSADGKFPSVCRAAIVTEVDPDPAFVSLAVLNPTGLFFDVGIEYNDGAEKPGYPSCAAPHKDGPHRYCACGWIEASHRPGTWHWPERA